MIYKKSWKYILTHAYGSYYRPKALKNFLNIKRGRLGGLVYGYHNLSQSGKCWVYFNAKIYEYAVVSGNAIISEYSKVFGKACVSGNAKVCRNAEVSENANVTGNAIISENAYVYGDTKVSGYAVIENRILIEGIYQE